MDSPYTPAGKERYPQRLQLLQDTFAAVADIPLACADPQGRLLTAPSRWGETLSFADGHLRLNATDDPVARAFLTSRQSGETALESAPDGRFLAGAVRLTIDQQVVGHWIIGPAPGGKAAIAFLESLDRLLTDLSTAKPCLAADDSAPPASAQSLLPHLNPVGYNTYITNANLFHVFFQYLHLLLTSDSLPEVIAKVLALLGDHFRLGRAYAYVRPGAKAFQKVCEWRMDPNSPRLPSTIDDDSPESGCLARIFGASGFVAVADISQLEPPLFELFSSDFAHSALLYSEQNAGEITGFVGFDTPTRHEWKTEEIILARDLCTILGGYVSQPDSGNDSGEIKISIAQNMLNRTGLYVVICEPDTHRILWTSDTVRNSYQGTRPLLGEICHHVFSDYETPCKACITLPDPPPDAPRSVSFQFHSAALQRTYVMHKGFIPWTQGKPAQIVYSLDVTKNVRLMQQYRRFLTFDVETGVLSHRVMINRCRGLLRDSRRNDSSLSILLLSLQHTEQDVPSNEVEDRLRRTAEAVRKCIREGDLIGRFGQHSFAVALPHSRLDMAKLRIAKAQHLLQSADAIFRFGGAENTELIYNDLDEHLNALFSLAESRMLGSVSQEKDTPRPF